MDSNGLQLHLATAPARDEILRDDARRALQAATEREVQEYIDAHSSHVDGEGRRLVVRNGHYPPRTIHSGRGSIQVRQPRVNDKRIDEEGNCLRFTSKILPPYLRKTKAIEELVPWLYLKGISTSDFPEALACLAHLSAASVVRMKELWHWQYENFSRRSLEGKRYVHPHDSGPVWLATPSPYGTCIHNTSPALPAHSQDVPCSWLRHARLAIPGSCCEREWRRSRRPPAA